MPEFAKTTGDPKDFGDKLKTIAANRGISVEYDAKIAPALGLSSGGRIRLAPGLAPLQEKLRKIGAQHQDRTLAVDDRQPSLDPMADGIPMDFQGAGDFVDRVAAQRFHAPAVGTSVAPCHESRPRTVRAR